MAELLHGTAIAAGGRAVLLRGPSGAGKSDLALRCIGLAPTALLPDQAMLVADDQVVTATRDQALFLSAPERLRGLIEVRGVGIVPVPHLPEARLALVADLVSGEDIERLPEPCPPIVLCGILVPSMRIWAFEASAPLKLLLALGLTS